MRGKHHAHVVAPVFHRCRHLLLPVRCWEIPCSCARKHQQRGMLHRLQVLGRASLGTRLHREEHAIYGSGKYSVQHGSAGLREPIFVIHEATTKLHVYTSTAAPLFAAKMMPRYLRELIRRPLYLVQRSTVVEYQCCSRKKFGRS